MIEKLLTLLSGNVLLTKKSIEEGNKTLTERLESSQNKTVEAINELTVTVKNVSEVMEKVAKAIEEREDREIEIPEIEIPEIKLPEFPKFPEFPAIPAPQVTVKAPEVVVPAPVVTVEPNITVTPTPVTFPEEMSVTGLSVWFQKVIDLLSKEKKEQVWSASNPIPVAFIDRKGRQYDLVHLGTPRGGTGGGATPSEITGADKTMRTVAFDISSTGVVVPAVAGRRIKVYAIKLTVDAPLSVAFRDGASTLLEGMQDYIANSGYIDNIQPPAFLMATSAGESLQLVVSGTGNVSGRVSYWSDDKV